LFDPYSSNTLLEWSSSSRRGIFILLGSDAKQFLCVCNRFCVLLTHPSRVAGKNPPGDESCHCLTNDLCGKFVRLNVRGGAAATFPRHSDTSKSRALRLDHMIPGAVSDLAATSSALVNLRAFFSAITLAQSTCPNYTLRRVRVMDSLRLLMCVLFSAHHPTCSVSSLVAYFFFRESGYLLDPPSRPCDIFFCFPVQGQFYPQSCFIVLIFSHRPPLPSSVLARPLFFCDN